VVGGVDIFLEVERWVRKHDNTHSPPASYGLPIPLKALRERQALEARVDPEIFKLGILDYHLVKGFLQRSKGRAEAGWLTQKEVVKRPHFPVTSVLMPPHEPRHSYEHCIVCHKPFRVYRSRLLRPGGMFCTQRCFWQAWRASDGR
jgi:hypothetical protein